MRLRISIRGFVRQSVRQSVRPSVCPKLFSKFEKSSIDDNDGTMSDDEVVDEVVASYVPPRYLFLASLKKLLLKRALFRFCLFFPFLWNFPILSRPYEFIFSFRHF